MLLRNADSVINGLISGWHSVELSEDNWKNGVPGLIKNYQGTMGLVSSYKGFFGVGSTDNVSSAPSSAYVSLLLGSNDADENYNDFNLELITTLGVSGACGAVRETVNGVHRCVLTKTFVNNTAEDVTVKEMGVYVPFAGQRGGSSSSNSVLITLIAREKLATPVTIPANGGVATFTMTITIPVVDNSAT